MSTVDYFKTNLPETTERTINKICETLLKSLIKITKNAAEGNIMLKWSLINLSVLIETQEYIIPFLSTKRFNCAIDEMISEDSIKVEDQASTESPGGTTLIELLLKVGFVYQPDVIQSLLSSLIKKAHRFKVYVSSDSQTLISLGHLIMYQIWETLAKSIKRVVFSFSKSPTEHLVEFYGQKYFKLVNIMKQKSGKYIKRLPQLERSKMCLVLQDTANSFYSLAYEIWTKNTSFAKYIMASSVYLSDFVYFLFNINYNLNAQALNAWLKDNSPLIIMHAEELKELKTEAWLQLPLALETSCVMKLPVFSNDEQQGNPLILETI